jgi:hypothetical protein
MTFNVGDTVAVNLPLTKKSQRQGLRKLSLPWRLEPWSVDQVHGDGTYTCRLGGKTKRINQTRVKLWLPSWSDLQRWRKLTWVSRRRISQEGERSVETDDSDAVSTDGEELLRDQQDAPPEHESTDMVVDDNEGDLMDVDGSEHERDVESDASERSDRSTSTRYPLRARPKPMDWGQFKDSGASLG